MKPLGRIPLHLLVILVVASSATPLSGSELPLSELIQGEWVAIEGTSNGEAAPEGALETFRLEFNDGSYRFRGSSAVDYTVDDSKDPAWVDIDNSLNQVGIAEVRDGLLYLCFGVRGDRPSEFSTKPYTDRTYLKLKRVVPEVEKEE